MTGAATDPGGDRSLDGRVAVVTGATGTLGGVVAERLAAAGARLVLAGRDRARLEAVAAGLELGDDRRIAVVGDLDAAGTAEIARASEAAFGRLDIVVHLVGGYAGGSPIAETEPSELETMLGQHVWTTFLLARATAPALQRSGRGRLIAVTSPFGANPPGGNAAYAAAKAAQESLVRSLAQESRGSGATANVIQVRTIDNARERLTAPSAKNARWTTPEEIASTIVWLSGPDTDQVTGTVIPLFGGPVPG